MSLSLTPASDGRCKPAESMTAAHKQSCVMRKAALCTSPYCVDEGLLGFGMPSACRSFHVIRVSYLFSTAPQVWVSWTSEFTSLARRVRLSLKETKSGLGASSYVSSVRRVGQWTMTLRFQRSAVTLHAAGCVAPGGSVGGHN